MKKQNKILIILLILLSIYSCRHILKNGEPTQKPPQGELVFKSSYHEFGKIEEGEIIKKVFHFKNNGPGPVKILKTVTSCGCTTAKAAFKEYLPGEEGSLEVTVDTKGKRGMMIKTIEVYMENSKKEKEELTLMAELFPPPHPSVENVLDIVKSPECKTCHLKSGVNQKGGFLYHRVCGQCHGRRGIGASASAFNNKEWQAKRSDEFIEKVIKNGMIEQGMPPYTAGVTPPLDDEQIKSLILYIRGVKILKP